MRGEAQPVAQPAAPPPLQRGHHKVHTHTDARLSALLQRASPLVGHSPSPTLLWSVLGQEGPRPQNPKAMNPALTYLLDCPSCTVGSGPSGSTLTTAKSAAASHATTRPSYTRPSDR